MSSNLADLARHQRHDLLSITVEIVPLDGGRVLPLEAQR